jgi:hypothetical protein
VPASASRSWVFRAADVHGPRQPPPNGSATLLFVIPTEACELQAHDHSVRALQSVSV